MVEIRTKSIFKSMIFRVASILMVIWFVLIGLRLVYIFNGQECYLYVPKYGEFYSGKLISDLNRLHFYHILNPFLDLPVVPSSIISYDGKVKNYIFTMNIDLDSWKRIVGFVRLKQPIEHTRLEIPSEWGKVRDLMNEKNTFVYNLFHVPLMDSLNDDIKIEKTRVIILRWSPYQYISNKIIFDNVKRENPELMLK